jgi:hypothetical protein
MNLKIEPENLVISRKKIKQSKIVKRPLTNIHNLDKLINYHNKLQVIRAKTNPLHSIFYCKNCLHYNGHIDSHSIKANGYKCCYNNCKCNNFESLGFKLEIYLPDFGTNILDILDKRFKNTKIHKTKDQLFWIHTEFRTKFRDYVKE